MEVSSEEAQAVLLEGMEGTQYITIQRGDSDTLNKGVSLLTLNGELISEGMVVDMINAGVASEYSAGTHFYETDDLLSHELTEEDRRLAAALVAVQLQQQQKQQLHSQSQHDDPSLPDVSQLETLTPVNAYTIQSMPETDPPPVYPTLQQQQHQQQQQQQQQRHHHQQQQPTYKRISQNVKQEFINVKSEYDIDVSAESSEDTAPTTPGPKRSLPHKKRIPRKLKQQSTAKKSTTRKDSNRIASELQSIEPVKEVHMFKCELCTSKFGSQLKFFEHLKAHYEPVKQESRIAQATNTNITISIQESIQTLDNTVIEEFSEPEDIMEGIRGVVEETGAHIDEDGDTLASNDEATLWTIADVTSQQPNARDNSGNADNAKRKKPTKSRKSANELTCPECDRTFHHKNSLVYHMRSHSGERPHQCEVCGKSFFAASALKVHKRLHSGDKPYKCEECGRHFRQWGDLKYHSTSIHSEQKQYQCEYCGKDFARKYSLIVHRRIHTGEKNYRCEYCSKTFRASSYLQNHRRIHTGEKPHACTVCGKPFRVRSDMKRHMHTHSRNRNTERSSNSKISKASGEKNENNGVITTANLQRDDTANSPQKIQHTQHQHHQIKGNNAQRTIQDLVRDLKLEVEANGVVEIVPPDDNPESILPHSGTQTLEYTTTNPERDPLESVERTSDSLQYFFM